MTSSKGIDNAKAVLSTSTETYMTVGECNSRRMESLVINLSDDVLIDTIMMSNHEDFSSPLGQVKFYGSILNPPSDDNWRLLGTLRPKPEDAN